MEQNKVIEVSLKNQFLSLYKLILSDNEVDPKELELLYTIGVEYGINKEEIQQILFESDVPCVTPDTIEEKVAYLFNLSRMAWANGKIDVEERDFIKKCVIRFQFKEENAEQIVDYFLTQVKEHKTLSEVLNDIK